MLAESCPQCQVDICSSPENDIGSNRIHIEESSLICKRTIAAVAALLVHRGACKFCIKLKFNAPNVAVHKGFILRSVEKLFPVQVPLLQPRGSEVAICVSCEELSSPASGSLLDHRISFSGYTTLLALPQERTDHTVENRA